MRGGLVTRHGIEPAGVPGMTAAETTQRQPAATQEAITLDGDGGILGTGRMETAMGAEKRTDGAAIKMDQ